MSSHQISQTASELISAGLAAAKKQGVKLGTPANITPEAQKKGSTAGNAAKSAAAHAHAQALYPIIEAIRAEGFKSRESIARQLQDRGIPNPRGGTGWWPQQVKRVIDRATSK